MTSRPRTTSDSQLPAAVILGMTTNGLAFARSLGRRGVPLFLLDNPAGRPALRTRYGQAIELPDLCVEPDAWLAALLDLLAAQPQPPVLIPTGDEHVLFLSRHREQLAPRARFRLADDGLLRALCDKGEQSELLAERGWPVPRTVLAPAGADFARLARETIGFPCLVKPCASHLWMRRRTGRKLTVARDEAELRRLQPELEATGEPFVLQEPIPGGDEELRSAIACCRAGEPLALFTKRKLRQYPVGFGNGSFQVSTHDAEVASVAAAIFRDLGHEGLGAIELKRDARDGRLVVIEINPRGVSGNQLAVDSGLDLPWIAYRDALDLEPPADVAYRAGVHYLHLPWDTLAFLALRRRGELGILEWVRSLLRVRSHALFAWRDPAPALNYVRMVARLWRRGELAGKLRN